MLLQGKKVMVTGGAGFLGSHLCQGLAAEGAAICALDTMQSGRKENLAYLSGIQLIEGNIEDKESLMEASQGMDVLVHAAFPLTIRKENPSLTDLNSALQGFFNVLETCLSQEMLLVQISSIAVYGNDQYLPIDEAHPLDPETVYGAVKLAEEAFCAVLRKTRHLKVVILRVADIFGPRNTRISVPIKFLCNAQQGKPNTVYGSGHQGRTYTYVADFVRAVILAIQNKRAEGEIFNIAGSKMISMGELAEAAREVSMSPLPVIFDANVQADSRQLAIDISKAQRILRFQPQTDFAEGLKLTYQWLLKNPDYWRV